MSQTTPITINCDPINGLCTLPENDTPKQDIKWSDTEELIYVGDPMCSWCWGISPQLNALKRYGEQEAIPFRIVMGGLRPGGGEEWTEQFRDFLAHHWQEVNRKTGQPFGYALFDLEQFNYDTEPACRAVVTVREIAPDQVLSFFELTQHYFYVKNKDPKNISFYEPICEKLNIDFALFSEQFNSESMRYATRQDFMLSSSWEVRGFPSVIYKRDGKLNLIARGYSSFDTMIAIIEKIDKEE